MKKLLILVLLFTVVAAAQEPVPTPPHVYIDTTWNAPNGRIWYPLTAAQLSLDLMQSFPGDTIVLHAGTTYSGNFTLPLKPNPSGQWIYIESSALSSLPAPGTRVAPGNTPNMPKITTTNTSAPINLAPGANHYRLVGLEITSNSTQGGNPSNNPPSNNFTYCLVCLNVNPVLGVVIPDSITIDRDYIHGSPTQDVGQGVQANGSNFAVIDSYISDIHESTFDSQAVLAFWTPGPIKIVDDYLSATTEDVMFGGAGGYNDPYVPSDIEIRRNLFFKPLTWESCGAGGTVPAGEQLANGSTCPVGTNNQWVEKDNLEFKSARRVVVTGNVMQNTWMSATTGTSVVFTPRTSQSGNIAVVDDVLFQSNLLNSVNSGISTLEADNNCGAPFGYPQCTNAGESKRLWIDNNLILLRDTQDTYQHGALKLDGGCSGCGPVNGSLPGETDFIFQHNTVLMADRSILWNSAYFSLPQLSWGCTPPEGYSSTHNVWVLDNAMTRQPNGDCGEVTIYGGITGLGYYMGDPAPLSPRFYGNVMYVPSGDRLEPFPAHNYATMVAFTYANPSEYDYQLTSPLWTDTTDGKVSGISWNSLQAATGISGPPPSPILTPVAATSVVR
jgi:hypothetical protein